MMIEEEIKGSRIEKLSVFDLILHRIQIRANLRIAWLRKIWIENETRQGGNSLNSHSEIDGWLNNNDLPVEEARWYSSNEKFQSLNEDLERIEIRLAEDGASRFWRLRSIFGLNNIELDILQACLAQFIDPHLGSVYAYLQDHNGRSYVTQQLVARLFQHNRFLILGTSSPLFVWGIVREVDMGKSEPARIEIDPAIRNWLLGSDDFDPMLLGSCQIQSIKEPLTNWPITELVEKIVSIRRFDENCRIRIIISGHEGTGRKTFAAAVAFRLGLAVISIQTSRVQPEQWPHFYIIAQRQGWTSNCALLWEGKIAQETAWPTHIGPCPIQFIVAEPDETILPNEFLINLRIELPSAKNDDIFLLWNNVMSTIEWPEEDLNKMIRRHQVTVGQVMAASKKNLRSITEAAEALKSSSRQRLGNLAQLINSSFKWDDLIVPATLKTDLDDLYYEASERSTVWEEKNIRKNFPQGKGLVALFTGSPGTGKTMAAQVIANRLQLDLFRIDLSAVVSKYVGETSKNLARILSRASRMNVVLLFDEADSLFGKRTEIKDAHDRYANTDTNYLLQAIEEYPGVAILATNRKGNIDSGFMRRLRFILEFPRPDAEHRFKLWSSLVSELTDAKNAALLKESMKGISEIIEVTGAQIKQAILSAIFIARRENVKPGIVHLLKGLQRELAKESRGVSREEIELIKRMTVINK